MHESYVLVEPDALMPFWTIVDAEKREVVRISAELPNAETYARAIYNQLTWEQ